ncbi:MAG: ABC-ATPase domain-containing protein [Eubacterium sp.]|nr:ABC-ATPase domain-containing protein [Eubacterium sp.]
MQNLDRLLRQNDHKPYPAYKALKGGYHFPLYTLSVDHVQGDPFAAPSSLSIRIEKEKHGFPAEYYNQPHRRIMLQDLLLRGFGRELSKCSHLAKGSGKSGTLSVSRCGEAVLERSALTIDPKTGTITVRFSAGFPAAGRTTLAMELKKMLFELVPAAVERSLLSRAVPKEKQETWIALSDDQKAIREQLAGQGLVAFIADGAILPRKSGVDDTPMASAVPFESPVEDRVTLRLPNDRTITGLGIKCGITLIVGGGYHGKSTLLQAIERGVYNHIPGDGREYVLTEDTAMKIRSEDGRSVKKLDISTFIRNLPNGKDTVSFSTEDASGSTSQASNTMEAVLSGSRTLLIDEDTSATNFMVRDALMQSVIHPEQEPIVPFLGRMRELYEESGISTVLVAGSSGAFFHVADRILQMKEYKPLDITGIAKKAAAAAPETDVRLVPDSGSHRQSEEGSVAPGISAVQPAEKRKMSDVKDLRVPVRNEALLDSRRVKVRGSGTDSISLNHESVELRFVEQVVDPEQANLLGMLLRTLEEDYFDGRTLLSACVERLYDSLKKQGFSVVHGGSIPGNLAMVRKQELYAMVNRYRALKLK